MTQLSAATEICTRFRKIDLHDSELTSFGLHRRRDERIDDLELSLQFLVGTFPDQTPTPARLVFLDCTYLKVDLDLGMKNVSADAISSASCFQESELRTTLETTIMKYEANPLAEYTEFVLTLCPPAGAIHIFAKDFDFSVQAAASR